MAKWICPVCGYVHEGDTAPEFCPQCKVPGSKFKKMEETAGLQFVTEHVIGIANEIPQTEEGAFVLQGRKVHFMGEGTEVGMDLAARFAALLREVVWDTNTNVEKRLLAEEGACAGNMDIAKMAKKLNLDAIHDSVHEMAKDEARHGAGFQGLFNRYFKK